MNKLFLWIIFVSCPKGFWGFLIAWAISLLLFIACPFTNNLLIYFFNLIFSWLPVPSQTIWGLSGKTPNVSFFIPLANYSMLFLNPVNSIYCLPKPGCNRLMTCVNMLVCAIHACKAQSDSIRKSLIIMGMNSFL